MWDWKHPLDYLTVFFLNVVFSYRKVIWHRIVKGPNIWAEVLSVLCWDSYSIKSCTFKETVLSTQSIFNSTYQQYLPCYSFWPCRQEKDRGCGRLVSLPHLPLPQTPGAVGGKDLQHQVIAFNICYPGIHWLVLEL